MTKIRFTALPTETVTALQSGTADANSHPPERHISDGAGLPCRHCLEDIAAEDPYLILAHCPFPKAQPYAEVGPIFLHAESCPRYAQETDIPAMFLRRENLLVRGYGTDDRIVYGTGQIAAPADLSAIAEKLLERPEIAYRHVRSASNNCYQCRIDRR